VESDESEAAGGTPEVIAEALERELAHERKRNEELLTRLKYMQADLENLRKRIDKEVVEARDSIARALLTRLIVIHDELELAERLTEEGEKGGDTMKEGISMVRRNLMTALESEGLSRIDAVGKPFDPAVHEAVEKVQGRSKEDIVIHEVRSGFMFRGTVLRPSMVKVELARQTKEEAKAK
jgi:molecular chaperone GrpE